MAVPPSLQKRPHLPQAAVKALREAGAVNRVTDGVGAVSNIGESQLTLSSFGLLTTNSVSCHCGTVFPDGMMDGAWEEWAGRVIGSMRAALGQGESRENSSHSSC